jgi:cytochrome P450
MMAGAPRPPGPRTLSPVGSLLPFSRDPLGFLYRLAMEHGDVAHFRAGRRDVYLLSHPDLVHRVLVADAGSFSKDRGLEMAKALLGEGLLTSEGEKHGRQRRLSQPAFHRERIPAYAAIMARRTAELTAGWREGLELDVGREMARLALRIVAEALFGEEVGEEAVATIGGALDDAMAEFTMARIPFHALLARLPVPSTLRLRRARARLDGVVHGLVAARSAAPRSGGADLLTLLLEARDEQGGGGFSASEVRDQVTTLLLAGHETTANALAWTFHLLSRHPAEEARLHRELDEALAGRDPGYADLPRLPYLGRVLSESMRLYPPAWTVARRALRSFTVRGYRIGAGSTVMMSQWVLHHHPAWFEEPFRFDPDRWTEDRRARRPRFSYFPFGGPRVCIGDAFATTEALLILATVARRWRLTSPDPSEVPPVARVTLRPARPIRATVADRRGAQRLD